MVIERTKNATRNMVFGITLRLYQILVPFLLRTAMIYFMGMRYLGLNSLFSSVLQVLNLAELGVGSAMVYSMYMPIAEDDHDTICALLRLYRLYYRVIGGVIAVIGAAITPFIPMLIKDSVPSELNVYTLYLLNLAATVFSYWIFAYKNSIFAAHQRVDVTSKISLAVTMAQHLIQFVVIIWIKDYYLYIIAALFMQIVSNVVTAICAARMYPNYKPEGRLSKHEVTRINYRIRDLFTAKLGSVIVFSVDAVVISAFLGLTVLAEYQNYYFILTAIVGVVSVIFGSCTAGIGNSVIVESVEKNFADLKTFTFLISWIGGFCTCCLLCLYQPFMELWVGRDSMLGFSAVVCFCMYYFITEINQLLNTYKDAAGMWNEDRLRPLVTALSNLVMNLITVRFWGIYGVLLSTVLSTLFIGMPWLLHNLFTVIFRREQLPGYLKLLAKYVLTVLISCVSSYLVCSVVKLPDWGELLLNAVICCAVPNVIYWFAFRRTPEFRACLNIIDRITRNKLKLEKRLT